MKYVAYCTKGLENVLAEEIASLIKNATIIEKADKRIIFESDADVIDLIKIRTADDIGFFLAEIKDIFSVSQIITALETIDVNFFINKLKKFRNVTKDFSVTASIAGNGRMKPESVLNELSDYIGKTYNANYTKLDHTNFDIRVFIDHTVCVVSIRLTKASLHHRTYKTASRIGSLRPTVAAAMILLATKGEQNKKIVDDFCGSGTILCEALAMGNDAYGGDIEGESVQITTTNLHNVAYNAEEKIKLLDATRTNWPDKCFDCAISNFPWDKQIKIGSITDLYSRTLYEYKRILKENGTFCFLVSKPDLFLKHAKHIFPDKQLQTIRIGLLGQNPTLIYPI